MSAFSDLEDDDREDDGDIVTLDGRDYLVGELPDAEDLAGLR